MEKDLSELGILFQHIIGSMKASYPMWEEMAGRASKLHTALRGTIAAITGFLESFQKLSDHAIGSRGATKDIGSSLTRLCFRHKSIENRLKLLTNALVESFVSPLQEHIETWKKSVVQLDKDHARDYKKAQHHVKKASTDTIKLKKKADKGKSDLRCQLDNAVEDLHMKHAALEATEKNAVRMAMTEERSHFCVLIKCLQPIMEQELAMLSEVTHLQDIVNNLCILSQDPTCLPVSTEQAIFDATQQNTLAPQTTLDRKKRLLIDGDTMSDRSASSSTGSIHNSVDSASSGGGILHSSLVDTQSNDSIHPSASGSSLQSGSAQGPTIADIPLPFDRPHTISSSVYQHGNHSRPSLAVDTFDPPPAAINAHSQRDYERSSVPVATPKVAEIYARPSLLIGKDVRNMPLAVATPTVPETNVKATPFHVEQVKAGICSSQNSSSERLPVYSNEVVHQTSSMSSDMSALAEAIRDLEANTAALNAPFTELQAPSCQSLQCSSGYSTMTNVSVGNAYSQETVTPSNDFEGLAESLLDENLCTANKYRTLPSKRVTQQMKNERVASTANRPVSTTGMKANFLETLDASQHVDSTKSGSAKSWGKSANFYGGSFEDTDSSITAGSSAASNVDIFAGESYDASAALPPPPAQLMEETNESDEDFPLPPPPDLDSMSAASSTEARNEMSAAGNPLLMHSLSMKLASRNSTSMRAPPPVAAKTFRAPQTDRSTPSDQSNNILPMTAVESDVPSSNDNNFLAQIQRGMSLRRAVSNDRSGPRVPSKN